jgi:5-formyltetrahydrofolate cyclo-ligase
MRFYVFSSLDELETGAYNIPEPNAECPEITETDNALCIVPGLAFVKSGHRIGFGRGYYDRFLSGFKGISCGVCFDEFILESIPCEPTDIPVELLITQSGKIK